MTTPNPSVNGWEQLSMLQPDVIEVILKVGIMHADNHCQAQIEVYDRSGEQLLAMQSRPHFRLEDADKEVTAILRDARKAILGFTGPFP
uniref:Uncharacterized protein n=1 Tax=uncultured prokaryote TaxID=198431 RepID=A0A0H5QQ35_9ZZZZ|nr:hypothetical protein [uncultured prokaryote]